MLAVEDLHVFYGASHVLQGVSLTVGAGEVCCLLGRNGAGKSTTLKSIVGFVPPRSGRITLRGVPLAGLPTHRISRLGVGYVPEDRRIFPTLTAAEHLRIAARAGNGAGPFGVEAVYRLFPRLRERAHVPGRALSGGEQQMLAIGRALVGNPSLLLLDEPSEGLGPLVVAEIRHVLGELKGAGLSTLLVEQNLSLARALGDRFVLLSKGRVVFAGRAGDLSPEDARRYLGV
jgi:branched-chain amino acid transport system ATP-binding protein